jgi:hypothetical protein
MVLEKRAHSDERQLANFNPEGCRCCARSVHATTPAHPVLTSRCGDKSSRAVSPKVFEGLILKVAERSVALRKAERGPLVEHPVVAAAVEHNHVIVRAEVVAN